jgi:tetratricopeptide (TPR) repeat protein
MRTKAGICRIFGLLAIWALLIAAPVAAADDAHTCASLSGDAGIAFCSKLIASGRFKGLDLAWLYNNRGAVQLNDKRDYDRAIADFTQALSVQKFVAGFANRGFAYYKKGDYDSAIADYTLVARHSDYDSLGVTG